MRQSSLLADASQITIYDHGSTPLDATPVVGTASQCDEGPSLRAISVTGRKGP